MELGDWVGKAFQKPTGLTNEVMIKGAVEVTLDYLYQRIKKTVERYGGNMKLPISYVHGKCADEHQPKEYECICIDPRTLTRRLGFRHKDGKRIIEMIFAKALMPYWVKASVDHRIHYCLPWVECVVVEGERVCKPSDVPSEWLEHVESIIKPQRNEVHA
ncbi:hypothetical protein TTSV1_gp03 [Thermoproteus tenax spherical virus 1]|uniref:Uncharacterized protein n=1 Tax=Thermoproteus tenax spherical virus 1 TaxID=292639 RepID=Q647F9_9VIRU|nr:hypothetical protein TTSV1_gp03 [Thermoproteus tenax spherical virus 1]AAU25953.1 hypothetical protein [Thermoproteus tenax spherical virus 1]